MAEFEDKDQKTEEATPRRRREARDRGQVALSNELVAAVGLLAGMAAFALGGGPLLRSVGDLVVNTVAALPSIGSTELTPASSAALVEASLLSVAVPLVLVMAPALFLTALAGYGQVGFQMAAKAIEPDPSKIDPIKGFGRVFSLRGVVRTALAAVKVMAVVVTVAVIAWAHVDGIVALGKSELGPLLVGVAHVALRCTGGAVCVILFLSLFDLAFQRFQHERDLRMSKKEVKEDHRLTEGDPHVKARVRQLQREMATQRMMEEVPKSTVVVTNPTHYAVALRYDYDEAGQPLQDAPVVVAKGVDHIAQRIKAIAAQAGVRCWEDVPLARALHAQVEVGQEIPEELYTAVAAVLGQVLRTHPAVAAAS